jgi:ABC-type polysaccharide/polyol phosphate transport system ATPase subunit
MSREFLVRAKQVSKQFLILRQEHTVFRSLGCVLRGEPLRREFWALRNISFSVERGERLALIGKNGSGKTTLLRLISGIFRNTGGALEVAYPPRVLFKFWIGFNGDLTVTDNVFLFGAVHGISRAHLTARMDAILQNAGLHELRFSFLKNLSSGQVQKLALCVFWEGQGDFFLFDESLAFVDRLFAERCAQEFEGWARERKTMVLASHDMAFIRTHCTRALWLEAGCVRMHAEVNDVVDAYERDTDSI